MFRSPISLSSLRRARALRDPSVAVSDGEQSLFSARTENKPYPMDSPQLSLLGDLTKRGEFISYVLAYLGGPGFLQPSRTSPKFRERDSMASTESVLALLSRS
nr:hypothetical protein Iba_chr11aCG17130 [Ipomoea batatas]